MATFYVLPPRECLERLAAEFVARVLPGLSAPPSLWEAILAEVTAGRPVYAVHREDLPGGPDLAGELADGFGAEPGDVVVEVGLGPGRVRRWEVPTAVSEPPAGR
jgi:hypothetical protein